MEKLSILEPGKYYHIYNCGINGENLFRGEEDYRRFLDDYQKYISPIAETYAWVLMKNHFHILVRIKCNIFYKYSNEDGRFEKWKFDEIKWETQENIEMTDVKMEGTCKLLVPKATRHFAHLFNAYAKYFNIKYERHGSLFERPFKRKEIEHINYFRRVVIYIHQNPVHHGFCDHVLDYGWSSYLTCISMKPTSLGRDEVIGWFDNVGNFKTNHNAILDRGELENYLGL
jgi:REP element-mobilizing transposase RayT